MIFYFFLTPYSNIIGQYGELIHKISLKNANVLLIL